MQALLVRHAIAADRTTFTGPDADRPLTEEGIRRFRRGARALAALVPKLDLVYTSPLVRARETAELVAAAHPAEPTVADLSALAPGGAVATVVARLREQKGIATVALVGHEPDLSLLEGFLLTGEERSLADFRKGGAALVELRGRPAAGGGVLLWHLTAGQLRKLAP